ncbi:MAG: hypothetical protein CUN53_16790, partial [Phototrophicales bacterium]
MFRRIAIALAIMTAAGMALAQEVSRVDFNGVGFDYTADVVTGVAIRTIPADPPDLMYPGGPRPGHTRFDLLD